MKRNLNKMKKSYDTHGKKARELTLTVSVFLLGREEVKGLFWNILNTHYEHQNNVINVGISTIEGKLGTTLQKLRKTAKYLSQYLYDYGLTFRKARVHFYVHTEDNELARVEQLLNTLEAQVK